MELVQRISLKPYLDKLAGIKYGFLVSSVAHFYHCKETQDKIGRLFATTFHEGDGNAIHLFNMLCAQSPY